jgi:sugar/nucleoside kinase (ribokinase family)
LSHQLLAVGNALVDILAYGTDDLLARAGVVKGGMTLVDEAEARRLYSLAGPAVETSGGSAANTAAGFVALGGTGVYVGKTGEDELGRVFVRDMATQGVACPTSPRPGRATGRSLIVVTPDGERSMSTHLGACLELSQEDVEPAFDILQPSGMVFVEGYLWDAESSRAAARTAVDTAYELLHPVAMTLSDPSCVDRWREEFLSLVERGRVEIVFANEKEFSAFCGSSDQDVASRFAMRMDQTTFVVTRGAKGCTVFHQDGSGGRTRTDVPSAPVTAVVDTTGAGDMFAAGYLRGVAGGLSERDCARLGSLAASIVIGRTGARAVFGVQDHAAFEEILDGSDTQAPAL